MQAVQFVGKVCRAVGGLFLQGADHVEEVLMPLHAPRAPHQAVRALVKDIAGEAVIGRAAPVVGVPVVVHGIQVIVQRRGAVALLQCLHRAL